MTILFRKQKNLRYFSPSKFFEVFLLLHGNTTEICHLTRPSGRIQNVIKEDKASGYTVYLLVNTILKITLHLQMLNSQLDDQQVAPLTILHSGAQSVL